MKPFDTKRVREAWGLFFTLGIVMLNYPFIHIFNKDTPFFGIPLLILYFFLGWPLSIVVIFLFSRRLEKNDGSQSDNDKRETDA